MGTGKVNRGPARRLIGPVTGLILGLVWTAVPRSAQAWWPAPYPQFRVAVQPPDQSWLNDVPERPGSRQAKVAVFVFQGDDVHQPMRAAVVRTLRRKGLNVTTMLKPVDSPTQFREMSSTLKVAAYVDADVTGEGAAQSAHIRVRSGVTGQHVAVANYAGPTAKIVGAINKTLWNKVGPATMHACSGAAHSHRREREPLRIEAGTPLDDASLSTPGT